MIEALGADAQLRSPPVLGGIPAQIPPAEPHHPQPLLLSEAKQAAWVVLGHAWVH